MSETSKLSLFDVLGEIGRKNYFTWDGLTEEERKQYNPVVMLKWMVSSGLDPIKLQRFNTVFFDCDQQLQLTLLSTASVKPKDYRWVWNRAKLTGSTTEVEVTAIQECYQVTRSTARSLLDLFTPEELEQLVTEYVDFDNSKTSGKKATKKARI